MALGARHKWEAETLFFFWSTEPCVYDTLGQEATHARFIAGIGAAAHQLAPADFAIRRLSPRLDHHYPGALWQSELSLPWTGRTRPWPQPEADLQSGWQDCH